MTTSHGEQDWPVTEVETLRAKVAALEHCLALSNESALLSAGRIRELEKSVSDPDGAWLDKRDAKLWDEAQRHEREACALAADGNVTSPGGLNGWQHGYARGRKEAAAAIRARGGG